MTPDSTAWFRLNHRTDELEFNHLSRGYDPDARIPTAINEEQARIWKGTSWSPVPVRMTVDDKCSFGVPRAVFCGYEE